MVEDDEYENDDNDYENEEKDNDFSDDAALTEVRFEQQCL